MGANSIGIRFACRSFQLAIRRSASSRTCVSIARRAATSFPASVRRAVFAGFSDSGSAVAIKLVKLEVGDDAHRELEFAASMAGRATKNIVPILDYGIDTNTGQSCIVMARAEASLRDAIPQIAKNQHAALDILLNVACGLLEAGDWVHRDLKPENILRSGRSWQIADFGIARIAQASTSVRTLKGALSPPYAAPEQWNDERASHATDIYALGCIGVEIACGNLPFEGPAVEDFARQHRSQQPLLGDLLPPLRSLLTRMIAKVAIARPSADRVISELEYIKSNPEGSGRGANKLAAAAAMIAEQAAIREAEQLAREAQQLERAALEKQALAILEGIGGQLLSEISKHAPMAQCRIENHGPVKIFRAQLGNADIRMTVGQHVAVLDFNETKWDVICGDAIVIEQQRRPNHQSQMRSASLWYADIKKMKNFEWIEVAYWPLTGISAHCPRCLPPDDAARVVTPVVGVWHLAYNP